MQPGTPSPLDGTGPNPFLEEKEEVRAVLASEAFRRSPTLAQLLAYICERYFAGEGGTIKEYSIAVEGLGRPADFDQKKDSIVRVEAHRLRKRLKEYYDTEGRDHRVRIELPLGAYAPVFHRAETGAGPLAESPEVEKPVAAESDPAAVIPDRRRSRRLWGAVASGAVLLAAYAALVHWPKPAAEQPPVRQETQAVD